MSPERTRTNTAGSSEGRAYAGADAGVQGQLRGRERGSMVDQVAQGFRALNTRRSLCLGEKALSTTTTTTTTTKPGHSSEEGETW